MSTQELTLTARWIFPADAPPCQRMTLALAAGRITALEPCGRRPPDIDLGNVAILPGLVNAHTHLDLTDLRGRCPPSEDFVSWLRQVIAHRRTATPEQNQMAIQAGIDECVSTGTTLVGDIASGGASWELLANAPLRSVVFLELLGLTEERAAQAKAMAEAWFASRVATPRCRPAISPHAPYSVRTSLLVAAAQMARVHAMPLAIHLAETHAEVDLLHHHKGPFVAFLKELGVWDCDALADSPRRVMQLVSPLAKRALFVHANSLAPSARIPRGSTIVYCPRTHAAFGHPPHPFRRFLEREVRVALGTDGLSSNPDLDLLAEVRFLHRRFPNVPGETLLRMATLSGAEALGWEDETGSLTPGKSADLVIVPLPDEDNSDPYSLFFASAAKVRDVMIGGQWIALPARAREVSTS